ncbi:MAG: AMP-binding protein [Alphaproteobacteria bacterium]
MLDLGRSLIAATERDPHAEAVVDGTRRFSYGAWFDLVSRLAGGLDAAGLQKGDRLATVLQNRWEMAALHWACQMLGVVITPLNWRLKATELDGLLQDSEAKAVAYEPVSTAAAAHAVSLKKIGVGGAEGATVAFDALCESGAAIVDPRAAPEDWSLMLYTSGTTGRAKGVPRRHRAERAAAVAHVAQNLYGPGERTLGAMPLYHTMGVRSLLAMTLINGCFVCMPRFDAAAAPALIEAERISTLYLLPTLYHDMLGHVRFADSDISSARKLGYAGASMTDDLTRRIVKAFQPDLFVNHYGSSEIYTFTICADAAAKPGSAGKAGLNQIIRVVRLDTHDPEARTAPGEEGEIIASLDSDEAFEGYWRRPDADAKALRNGWYFTGDLGYVDDGGDLFVTGRVDDMIITGGENVSPVEVESVLSLHGGVSEVAVVGLADPRWGHVVTAFVVPAGGVDAETLDGHCRESAWADFKRPRDYVFVAEIPKTPVGKILRRKLVAGEYVPHCGSKLTEK